MSASPTGRFLVVDDETDLAQLIQGYLRKAGFEVALRHTGPDAVEAVRELAPEVLVLNLGLPGLDGVEVCRQVRTFSNCYILMLTARDDEVDKLVGLSVGADDYMTKPFSPRELVARVQAMMRRTHLPMAGRPALTSSPAVSPGRRRVIADLVVDESAREALLGGSVVPLTRIEFDLLTALATYPKSCSAVDS